MIEEYMTLPPFAPDPDLVEDRRLAAEIRASPAHRAQHIAELEHDANEYVPAVVPLGKNPDHCPECKRVADQRAQQAENEARQAACPHASVESIDIRQLCDPAPRELRHCTDCGKTLQ